MIATNKRCTPLVDNLVRILPKASVKAGAEDSTRRPCNCLCLTAKAREFGGKSNGGFPFAFGYHISQYINFFSHARRIP